MIRKIERLSIFETIESMTVSETHWPEIIDPKWELAQYAGATRARLMHNAQTPEGRQSSYRAKEKRALLEGLTLGKQARALEWKIIIDWDKHNHT